MAVDKQWTLYGSSSTKEVIGAVVQLIKLCGSSSTKQVMWQ